MQERRITVKKFRGELSKRLRKAALEYNTMGHATPPAHRVRYSERVKVLEELAIFLGGVRLIRYEECAVSDCNTTFAAGIGRRKYCSPACRQKAYRERRKRL